MDESPDIVLVDSSEDEDQKMDSSILMMDEKGSTYPAPSTSVKLESGHPPDPDEPSIITGRPRGPLYLADGKTLVYYSLTEKKHYVHFLNLETHTRLRFQVSEYITSISVSGNFLAVASRKFFRLYKIVELLNVLSVNKGNDLSTFLETEYKHALKIQPNWNVWSDPALLSPNGKFLVLNHHSLPIVHTDQWYTRYRDFKGTYERDHNDNIISIMDLVKFYSTEKIAFTPDSNYLAVACSDKYLRVYRVEVDERKSYLVRGRIVLESPLTFKVTSIAFSPKMMALGDEKGKIHMYNVQFEDAREAMRKLDKYAVRTFIKSAYKFRTGPYTEDYTEEDAIYAWKEYATALEEVVTDENGGEWRNILLDFEDENNAIDIGFYELDARVLKKAIKHWLDEWKPISMHNMDTQYTLLSPPPVREDGIIKGTCPLCNYPVMSTHGFDEKEDHYYHRYCQESAISLSFSSDGKLLVSAYGNENVVIWDLALQKILRAFRPDELDFTSKGTVAFSPDDKQVISALRNDLWIHNVDNVEQKTKRVQREQKTPHGGETADDKVKVALELQKVRAELEQKTKAYNAQLDELRAEVKDTADERAKVALELQNVRAELEQKTKAYKAQLDELRAKVKISNVKRTKLAKEVETLKRGIRKVRGVLKALRNP